MNAVEIEEAVSALAEETFDSGAFPFAFLEAFGAKPTILNRLAKGSLNKSDMGGVLRANNIHIKTCATGEVTKTLTALKQSPATTKAKAKFLLATDGVTLEAEDLKTGDTIACTYIDFPNHFGFFLPLAGITTVAQIRESTFDIRATSRLNKLYVELLKDNEDWATKERRADMNHFMARLIFCFFAEDTDIFFGDNLFTATIEQMSEGRKGATKFGNTDQIISKVFTAMDIAPDMRKKADLPRWADAFPYVNGSLFSGSAKVPKFTRIARSYLLHVGNLDWKKINPDIFGSMIQAVADEEERGALGMHYTSVPNILKVLNPLLLDDLYAQLERADENPRKLSNLRNRMARIRVFDPACGSGNFLVIAYKEMRKLEAEIDRRRKEEKIKSGIKLTNFRGIELKSFPAEVARLALIIAEFQCDVTYRGQQVARESFLPLDQKNWITRGNALRLDWLSICPPTGKVVKPRSEDLFETPDEQTPIDFENEGGETYICGNPPYLGTKKQIPEQKEDLKRIFDGRAKNWKSLDYVAGWFMKAADYGTFTNAASAFVSTNSINQGQQVSILWPLIFGTGHGIAFAHTSFKWANLASKNAGVTVVIVGIFNNSDSARKLFSISENGGVSVKEVGNINAYLVSGANIVINTRSTPLSNVPEMTRGNSPTDGGFLLMKRKELASLKLNSQMSAKFIRKFYGSDEVISGLSRYCIWIEDSQIGEAMKNPVIKDRIENVCNFRLKSSKLATRAASNWPHRFDERKPIAKSHVIAIPIRSSENRPYLPADLLSGGSIIANTAFSLVDGPLWTMAIVASRVHIVWIGTVCARLEMRFSYTNTVGWNTFPVPPLTEKNKTDLTTCAENILLAREAHFPATIADLYKPADDKHPGMPQNLRAAHAHNDEMLERIYIGRRFKNDTERLEKLFELYTRMTTSPDFAKPH